MSEAKHTPGPWSYAPAVPGAQRCFYIAGNQDANNREVDIGTVEGGYYSCEANARLIAAAPDLLEALIDTLDFLERHSNRWDGVNGKHPQVVVTAARAAIAKAEGKL